VTLFITTLLLAGTELYIFYSKTWHEKLEETMFILLNLAFSVRKTSHKWFSSLRINQARDTDIIFLSKIWVYK